MKIKRNLLLAIILVSGFFGTLYSGYVSAIECSCYTGGCGGVPLEQPSFEVGSPAACAALGSGSCNPFNPGKRWGCFF